jgi:hypothetical protein
MIHRTPPPDVPGARSREEHHASVVAAELERLVPGAPYVVYDGDNHDLEAWAKIATELLELASVKARCTVVPDEDVVEIRVDSAVYRSDEIQPDYDPLLTVVGCVNEILDAKQILRNWNLFREEDWEAELGVVLVNGAQLEVLCEADMIYLQIFDPAEAGSGEGN